MLKSTIHTLKPQAGTMHGKFSAEIPPALTIAPGDSVVYQTTDVSWGLAPPTNLTDPREKFTPRREGIDDGIAMCGPVAIQGAMTGMTLAIHIEEVIPGPWGWTYSVFNGSLNSAFNESLGLQDEPMELFRWDLDTTAMQGTNQHGHQVSLRPFLGTIGMPPAAPGMHESWYPRATGGNMDCKELIAGSTLYLPIEAPGGLVSVGDGHAAQGDGESCGMAIECPMERVVLRYELEPSMKIQAPRAHTPAGWVTLGFDRDLDAAIAMALGEMLRLLQERFDCNASTALALASVAVDVRISQLVNGVRGAHAILPHDAIRSQQTRSPG